jgi:hypothetical protein
VNTHLLRGECPRALLCTPINKLLKVGNTLNCGRLSIRCGTESGTVFSSDC